jgi:hypothetical protein
MPGPHHIQVSLEVGDASLTFNDSRFATFAVRGGRRVLTITDDPKKLREWDAAVTAWGFTSEVKSFEDIATWSPTEELARYQAICLVHLTPARPDGKPRDLRDFWERLRKYVEAGGGLAIVPGDGEMNTPDHRAAYNDDTAQKLMPGKLLGIADAGKEGAPLDWQRAEMRHRALEVLGQPLSAWFAQGNNYFKDYINEVLGPRAYRYWQLEPKPQFNNVIIPYQPEGGKWPALIERIFADNEKVRGRVLAITVPMDDKSSGVDNQADRWHNFLAVEPIFYRFLVRQTIAYLVGDDRQDTLNFQCGQSVVVPVPATPRFANYRVQGPEVNGIAVPRVEEENEVRVPQAIERGSYTVLSEDAQMKLAGFSLNDASEESQLLPRVPKEQIEALFGPDSVLELDYRANLKPALEQRWSQPTELFPLLMILLLLLLAIENLLSNKFYRKEGTEEQAPAKPASEEAAPAEKGETVPAGS